jgi:hypothetical protein
VPLRPDSASGGEGGVDVEGVGGRVPVGFGRRPGSGRSSTSVGGVSGGDLVERLAFVATR